MYVCMYLCMLSDYGWRHESSRGALPEPSYRHFRAGYRHDGSLQVSVEIFIFCVSLWPHCILHGMYVCMYGYLDRFCATPGSVHRHFINLAGEYTIANHPRALESVRSINTVLTSTSYLPAPGSHIQLWFILHTFHTGFLLPPNWNESTYVSTHQHWRTATMK